MGREVEFKQISTVLDRLNYPITQSEAAAECSDVTVVLADGEANLGKLVSETTVETFENGADIESELHNVLPREAVGEPYQSEGDS